MQFLRPAKRIRFKASFIIFINIIGWAGLFLLSQLISGRVCLEPASFAADDAGTVYIGQQNRILCIYNDGTIREIQIAYYDDGYGLSVGEDALLIGVSDELEGERVRLSDGSIEQVTLASALTPGNRRYTTDSGDVYRLKNRLLRYRIERQTPDGAWQTIYTMSARDFSVKIALLLVYGVGLPLLVLLTLYSAWTQGCYDGKTHGKPLKMLVEVTIPSKSNQDDME